MRYPEGHKEEVKARILRAASRALREQGIDGVSIPALMKSAGLTHGAFYSHFENRDALVADALEAAGQETAASVFEESANLSEALQRYLSMDHVQHPEMGCVVAALAGEGARKPAAIRRSLSHVTRGLIDLVAAKLQSKKKPPSDEALRITATMVGAVVLARALEDQALARRVLSAAQTSG